MNYRLLAMLGFLSTGVVNAQWIPIIADQTTTIQQFDESGNSLSTGTYHSRYLRSSSGNVVYQTLGSTGKPRTAQMVVYDGKRGLYKVDYMKGKVQETLRRVVQQRLRSSEADLTPLERANIIGHESVNNIECVVEPMYRVGPNRTRIRVGKAWVAPKYNFLTIKQDYVVPLAEGGEKRYTVTLSNITTDREPDAEEFARDRVTIIRHWLQKYASQSPYNER
jgi:hypothetical protein